LVNALKFTPGGGHVWVRVETRGQAARVVVRDDGQGISRDVLPHVFDRFWQADTLHGGLGLGLAIVRHLVDQHRGTVWAESTGEGRGATFIVELPLDSAMPTSEEEPAASAPEPDGAPRLDGLSVLVVDDDPEMRELMTMVLEEHGAKVRAVASAREALAALRTGRPDVLLSDIAMPAESGYELIRKVKASHGLQLAAAALTAHARSDDVKRAMQAGFDAHLAKPIHPTRLVAAVARLANRPGSHQRGH
jgi:CheY-like chemotaxis protein